MKKNLNIKDNLCLFIAYVISFFMGTTIGAIIDYLGNAEAIKLSRINQLESLIKYFHYSTYSYEVGILFLIFGGVSMLFLMTHKILFFEYIEKEEE